MDVVGEPFEPLRALECDGACYLRRHDNPHRPIDSRGEMARILDDANGWKGGECTAEFSASDSYGCVGESFPLADSASREMPQSLVWSKLSFGQQHAGIRDDQELSGQPRYKSVDGVVKLLGQVILARLGPVMGKVKQGHLLRVADSTQRHCQRHRRWRPNVVSRLQTRKVRRRPRALGSAVSS
jgi:hypothetical protein